MKPNVLFLLDSFEQGGSERQALQLLRQLHESTSSLLVISPQGKGYIMLLLWLISPTSLSRLLGRFLIRNIGRVQ